MAHNRASPGPGHSRHFFFLRRRQPVGGLDLAIILLLAAPYLFGRLVVPSNLPITGGGFDNAYRVVVMVAIIYALSVRNLGDFGCRLDWRWRHAIFALLAGLGLYFALVGLSLFTGTGRPFDYGPAHANGLAALIATVMSKLLHTALYEELMFRSVIYELLRRYLGDVDKARTALLLVGGLFLGVCAVLGFRLQAQWPWFPLIMGMISLGFALHLIRQHPGLSASVASLALTAMLFGLAHAGKRSALIIGMAMLAGWVYGWVFIRTRGLIYAALTHGMVGAGQAIFGFRFLV